MLWSERRSEELNKKKQDIMIGVIMRLWAIQLKPWTGASERRTEKIKLVPKHWWCVIVLE